MTVSASQDKVVRTAKGAQNLTIPAVAERLRLTVEVVEAVRAEGVFVETSAGIALPLKTNPERVYLDWLERTTPPHSLAGYDKVRKVHGLLDLNQMVEPPQAWLDDFVAFLAEQRTVTIAELNQLNPCGKSKAASKAITGHNKRAEYRRPGAAPVKLLVKILPEGLRALPGTALDPVLGETLHAPPEDYIARLLDLVWIRAEASVYLFHMAARVVQRHTLRQMINKLERLDERLAQAGVAATCLSGRLATVITGLTNDLSVDGELANRDREDADALIALCDYLVALKARGDIPSLPLIEALALQDPTAMVLLRKARSRGMSRLMQVRHQMRMSTAGSLADMFNEVDAKAGARFAQVQATFDEYRAALTLLREHDYDAIEFSVVHIALGPDGEATGSVQTTHWCLWRYDIIFAELASRMPAPDRHLRERLSERVRKRAPDDPYAFLEYRGVSCSDPDADPPFFVTLFEVDFFRGSYHLPLEVRERRRNMLLRDNVFVPSNIPEDLFDFAARDRRFAIDARVRGLLIIPIEQFMRATRFARTLQVLCYVAAPRANELYQLRGDGMNLGFDEGLDLKAYWKAVPKHRGPGEFVHFRVSDAGIDLIAAQISANVELYGAQEAVRPMPPTATLSQQKITEPFPPLFRSETQPLTATHFKDLLSVLLVEIITISVHDIRSAWAKYMLDEVGEPEFIRDWLNHRNMATTYIYTRQTAAMAQRALEQQGDATKIAFYLDFHDHQVAVHER